MTTKSAPQKRFRGTAYKEEEEIIHLETKGKINFMIRNRWRKKSQEITYHSQHSKTANPALIREKKKKNNNTTKPENPTKG